MSAGEWVALILGVAVPLWLSAGALSNLATAAERQATALERATASPTPRAYFDDPPGGIPR